MAFRLVLAGGDGFDLTEAGTQKRLAIFVVTDPREVPQVAGLGPDPLSADLGPEEFAAILARAGHAQLRGVLRDQEALAGIGNAYSDEILHAARLSPFTPVNSLDAAGSSRLLR